jgi:hypothetical protein
MTIWIINKIVIAYIISTLSFLTLILFFKKYRRRTNIFLNKSNIIIVFFLCLNLVWCGEDTIKILVTKTHNLKKPWIYTSDITKRDSLNAFVFNFSFAFIFQTLFFVNRFRTKISITIISIILLCIFSFYDNIVFLVTNSYREYVQLKFFDYVEIKNVGFSILFASVYFLFCWTNNLDIKKKTINERPT